jgi:hypothetical protein
MKRLRFSRSHAIRFYACGEYGETTRRPHYHAILFNCGFPDALVHSKNNRGELLYTSADLGALWDNGQHLIGDVTFASAAYVARYCVKKVSGEKADEHYSVFDADGVIHERLPEFALMSRRPGIGGSRPRYGRRRFEGSRASSLLRYSHASSRRQAMDLDPAEAKAPRRSCGG